MCGICGIFSFSADRQPDGRLNGEMMQALVHRGPDGKGSWASSSVVLGHRRLSIIDLSENGKQPMTNEDETLWLTYNGEIYNYLELRKELISKGHVFFSQTDSEVIIHAYEEYGTDCLNRFNGMFAFALYDVRNRTLFCARDRFGIKPFYYHVDKNRFIFASEIKALLCDSEINRTPNDKMIFDYLVFNRNDFSSETFFGDILRLEPGCFLTVDSDGLSLRQWWKIHAHLINSNVENAEESFRRLFINSVELRLRSDVPVGSCLSGGLDSSSIVTVVRQLNAGIPLKTFSAVYESDWQKDEKKYVDLLLAWNQMSGCFTYPSGDKFFHELEDLIYYQDEPFGGGGIYAQWEVMKLAHDNGLKVLLDGQGSDELLAGYLYFFGFYFHELLHRKEWQQCWKEFVTYWKKHKDLIGPQILLFLLCPGEIRDKLLYKIRRCISRDFFATYKKESVFNQFFFDTQTLNDSLVNHFRYKLEHLLRYEDRNSMAYSIEARTPFLDYRLVESSLSLPSRFKIEYGETKTILRRSMRGMLPDTILARQDKIGFDTPEDQWFRQKKFRELIESTIFSRSFKERGYFNLQNVERVYRQHLAGKRNASADIWKWINLEMWFRRFFGSA
jgi:asparagine synthase (glutamine-hydrolysing)